ncbi:rh blood group, D antigen isoform X2 [Oryzias melastigma]|uniref:Rh blood group, D antigen n=1 Tax=Oryzias melastigma TaxID=30732 RepID=A0A3B3C3B0_ORYME|nr:rh blood group, D antigen isoform X2 [Oryzias melastigma]
MTEMFSDRQICIGVQQLIKSRAGCAHFQTVVESEPIQKPPPMAPRYAPSLRSRLGPLLLFLLSGFIISAFYFEIRDEAIPRDKYAEFQDVNVMVVLGFGFLCTFLVRHGFSSSGFNLFVATIATQWALILMGIESWYDKRRILVDLRSILVAEMSAASALISLGAVLGKVNPVQLILLALLEVPAFILNEWVLLSLLKVRPQNNIMLLHIFGAFFGLTLTWILHRKGSQQGFEKEKFDKKSGLFSMLGSLFLWMFWPTFNSVLVDDRFPERKLEAVCSTYLALAVSAVTAASVSVLSSARGKLNLIQMQSCILAGGVAVGASMTAVHQPWEAMAIGFTAAVLSTTGFKYLKSHMLLAFDCHDTAATLSTHGLPGLLGWFAHLILEIKNCDDHTVAIRFAVFHICTLLVTITISLTTGALTGFLLSLNFWRPPQNRKCFDDQAFWEFPHLAVRK